MTKKLHPSQHKAKINKLAQEAQNSIWYRIKQLQTREEKIEMIKEGNPLLYVFGEYQRVWKDWMSYEDNMNELYIGEPRK